MCRQAVCWGRGLDLSGLELWQAAGFCESVNEPSVYIDEGKLNCRSDSSALYE
jgi:hypothetical protein